jgi:hypothetical protein
MSGASLGVSGGLERGLALSMAKRKQIAQIKPSKMYYFLF